jgi:hypothetical protein
MWCPLGCRRSQKEAPAATGARTAWRTLGRFRFYPIRPRRGANVPQETSPPEQLPLSDVVGTSPRGILSSSVSRARFCADRCVLLVRRQAAPGWRGAMGLGWPTGGQHGQGGGLPLLLPPRKLCMSKKLAGELVIFSFSDLLQQPVMPMISIHILHEVRGPGQGRPGPTPTRSLREPVI